MDRRHFFTQCSLGLAGLCLPKTLLGEVADLLPNKSLLATLSEQPLTCFAFGSCNESRRNQQYWQQIALNDPQLWLWLGDNIYGDGLNMGQRQQLYTKLKENAYYSAFRAQYPIIGTWDDHDFAFNNMDGHFSSKAASKIQILNFLDLNQDPEIMQRSGIYQSYKIGPSGQRTKIILLDLRYNQNIWTQNKALLGEEQWQWFTKELASNDFDLLLVGSSLNVTSLASGFGLEGWNNFGAERQRLYQLLAQVDCPILILSGDRHQADISKLDLGQDRFIYEFMSSGLTHSGGDYYPSPYRISSVISDKNYGRIDIDWTSAGPKLRMQIKSPNSNAVLVEQWTD